MNFRVVEAWKGFVYSGSIVVSGWGLTVVSSGFRC